MRIPQDIAIPKHERESQTYIKYRDIIRRCYDPKNKDYRYYGARGIKVYEPWIRCYWLFKDYLTTLGDHPEHATLDRIDNDGDYCPGNLRWADSVTQNNNKSNNLVITFNGETKRLTDWSTALGIPYMTLYARIKHWSIEDALTRPTRRYQQKAHVQQEMRFAA